MWWKKKVDPAIALKAEKDAEIMRMIFYDDRIPLPSPREVREAYPNSEMEKYFAMKNDILRNLSGKAHDFSRGMKTST